MTALSPVVKWARTFTTQGSACPVSKWSTSPSWSIIAEWNMWDCTHTAWSTKAVPKNRRPVLALLLASGALSPHPGIAATLSCPGQRRSSKRPHKSLNDCSASFMPSLFLTPSPVALSLSQACSSSRFQQPVSCLGRFPFSHSAYQAPGKCVCDARVTGKRAWVTGPAPGTHSGGRCTDAQQLHWLQVLPSATGQGNGRLTAQRASQVSPRWQC